MHYAPRPVCTRAATTRAGMQCVGRTDQTGSDINIELKVLTNLWTFKKSFCKTFKKNSIQLVQKIEHGL